jgi:hypothetical protein
VATYSGSTIYSIITNNLITNGTHTFTLTSGTSQSITNVAVKNFYGDYIYTGDPAAFDDITTDDSVMCVRIFHGNLTINESYTFDPPKRTRGFFVFVKGNLTNHGTISMSGKGANASVPTANLQIWGSAVIPRFGQTGASSVTTGAVTANTGVKGIAPSGSKPARGTGGGGSGGARKSGGSSSTTTSGAGGQGTIWAGGGGGGGATGINANVTGGNATNSIAGAAVINASSTPGGTTIIVGGGSGAIAGNGRTLGGSSTGAGTAITDDDNTAKGENESGGLLIIACLGTLTNNNAITSTGTKGGDPSTGNAGGGASGGGSINLLYKAIVDTGTESVTGGIATNVTGTFDANGGAGGDGSYTHETIAAAGITVPRRTLINAGGSLYYRNFTAGTWVSAGTAGTTIPFEQYGMFDAELSALDRLALMTVPGVTDTAVRFDVYEV